MLYDELADTASPLPPALRDALGNFAAGVTPDAPLGYMLGTVLPTFVRTGRPLATLIRYVPSAPVVSQLVDLLRQHPAAATATMLALEYAEAFHASRTVANRASGRNDDAVAHNLLRRMVAAELRQMVSAGLAPSATPQERLPPALTSWLGDIARTDSLAA